MFKSVDKYPQFPVIERNILNFWAEYRIFNKLRDQNAGKPHWSFLDGPITANNPMGVHHAWGRSLKDIFQRYHAMCGKELRYQNGFDCQGLWVEVEVEKEHGFHSKKDIVEFGIDQFVRECKERVLTFAAKQTEQSVRLGNWMDWDDPETLLKLRDALHNGESEVTITTPTGKTVSGHPEALAAQLGQPEWGGSYFTFSSENNYTIWHFLKKCHEEGFIYRGTDVMPWCHRCGTGISQMEVAEGRKITTHTSVFVRFPLRDRANEAFLVWTTTPWTLSSNVAVAVNPEMTYLKLRHGDWIYYVGKNNFHHQRLQELEVSGKRQTTKLQSLESIFKGLSGAFEILEELPGEALLGLTYTGPYDHLPAQLSPGGLTPVGPSQVVDKTAVACHRAIAWKAITGTEGTGIVHIAPGCGAEDYLLGRQNGLVNIAPLNESGDFLPGFGMLEGRNVETVTERIVDDLKTRGLLVAKEQFPHVYPHCWRCKTPLVFRLVDGWYIRMDWRDRIQQNVPKVRWIPADGEAREQDWLRNMGDWMISKKRFWGLALPIWQCDSCDWFDVIGNEAELQARATSGWEAFAGHSPHRPYIDNVTMRCDKCGGTAHRISDVANPWLDAGIVPFSTMHFNDDKEYWQQWFPADLVIECFPGQFRNWFYALLAMSAIMDGRAPFKVLLGYALVRDEHGEEMHKSKGNAILFDEAADVLGADVMRYIYASQNSTTNLNFPSLQNADNRSERLDTEVRKKLLTFWNCYSFLVTYAQADNWQPGTTPVPLAQRDELDRWILSKLQHLIEMAHQDFAEFATYRLMARIEQFNEALSNWYLRRSRRRFWKSESDTDKLAAFESLYEVLTTQIQLLAPILPFLTEDIYQNLVRSTNSTQVPESIHLTAYPTVNEAYKDPALESKIDCVIRTKNMGLNLRNQAHIKIRQPLSQLLVKPRDEHDRAVLADQHFVHQVLEECNFKALTLIDSEAAYVSKQLKVNFKSLGPKFGKQMKDIAKQVQQTELEAIEKAFEQNGCYRLALPSGEVELTPEDLAIQYQSEQSLVFDYDGPTFFALMTEITPALAREGIARDFNRHAQNLRKEIGLEVVDRIVVEYQAPAEIVEAVTEHADMLRQELLAVSLKQTEPLSDRAKTIKIAGYKVELFIRKA